MNAVMMVETRSAEFVPLRQGASATEYALPHRGRGVVLPDRGRGGPGAAAAGGDAGGGVFRGRGGPAPAEQRRRGVHAAVLRARDGALGERAGPAAALRPVPGAAAEHAGAQPPRDLRCGAQGAAAAGADAAGARAARSRGARGLRRAAAACRVLPDADGGGGRRPGGHAAGPQHGAAHAQPVCAVALPAHGGRGAVGRAARARGGAHPRGQRAGHGPLLQGHDPQPAPAAQAQPDREQPAERHHGAGRGRRVVRGRAEGGGAARRRDGHGRAHGQQPSARGRALVRPVGRADRAAPARVAGRGARRGRLAVLADGQRARAPRHHVDGRPLRQQRAQLLRAHRRADPRVQQLRRAPAGHGRRRRAHARRARDQPLHADAAADDVPDALERVRARDGDRQPAVPRQRVRARLLLLGPHAAGAGVCMQGPEVQRHARHRHPALDLRRTHDPRRAGRPGPAAHGAARPHARVGHQPVPVRAAHAQGRRAPADPHRAGRPHHVRPRAQHPLPAHGQSAAARGRGAGAVVPQRGAVPERGAGDDGGPLAAHAPEPVLDALARPHLRPQQLRPHVGVPHALAGGHPQSGARGPRGPVGRRASQRRRGRRGHGGVRLCARQPPVGLDVGRGQQRRGRGAGREPEHHHAAQQPRRPQHATPVGRIRQLLCSTVFRRTLPNRSNQLVR
ncbi:hypothetical protein KL943_000855 [Ogataea angusta]|nr:hypothetical protein KL943_000855 [Ogataea angusta]